MSISNTVCSAESLDSTTAPRCPVCSTPGKPVRPETVQGVLQEDRIPDALDGYTLCLSQHCDVIYFGAYLFRKDDVKVKVWFKETDPSRPVCYCAGVTEQEISEHILRGCCRDIKDIQQHTGANAGRQCLTKNPAGT